MQWLRDALTLVKGRPRDQGETSQCDTLTFEEICNTLNTDNRMTGLQTIFNSKSNLHGVPATVNMVKKTLVSMSPIMLRKRKGSKAKDGEALDESSDQKRKSVQSEQGQPCASNVSRSLAPTGQRLTFSLPQVSCQVPRRGPKCR